MVKCYRAETMARLEALRVMYAGQLLEIQQKLTEPQRYRIIRTLIQTICPREAQNHEQAYLDCIYRSPNATWNILVDSCRTANIFN